MVIRQFDIYLVKLDPTVGSEMKKTRPCLVITPESVNRFTRTVLVAPFTSTIKHYPCRIPCNFSNRPGEIALDQIRCADHSRLLKHLGRLDVSTQSAVIQTLTAMFDPRDH
jgi:mRNA interferase MazF